MKYIIILTVFLISCSPQDKKVFEAVKGKSNCRLIYSPIAVTVDCYGDYEEMIEIKDALK